MNELEKKIQEQLFELQDVKYTEFHQKLIPTVDKDKVIGVRTPALRKFTTAFAKTPEAQDFLQCLPHSYYEENNLHAFLIEKMKDYGECIDALNQFLPCVDNWATCDAMSPKILKKHLPELLEQIKIWIQSEHIYTVRFAIKMLMDHFLDEEYETEYSDMVAAVRSEEYYINMMVSWYFATALAKQYDRILPYIQEKRLDKWCHNKTIQKAVESYRITAKQKVYLKTLKIK